MVYEIREGVPVPAMKSKALVRAKAELRTTLQTMPVGKHFDVLPVDGLTRYQLMRAIRYVVTRHAQKTGESFTTSIKDVPGVRVWRQE